MGETESHIMKTREPRGVCGWNWHKDRSCEEVIVYCLLGSPLDVVLTTATLRGVQKNISSAMFALRLHAVKALPLHPTMGLNRSFVRPNRCKILV